MAAGTSSPEEFDVSFIGLFLGVAFGTRTDGICHHTALVGHTASAFP